MATVQPTAPAGRRTRRSWWGCCAGTEGIAPRPRGSSTAARPCRRGRSGTRSTASSSPPRCRRQWTSPEEAGTRRTGSSPAVLLQHRAHGAHCRWRASRRRVYVRAWAEGWLSPHRVGFSIPAGQSGRWGGRDWVVCLAFLSLRDAATAGRRLPVMQHVFCPWHFYGFNHSTTCVAILRVRVHACTTPLATSTSS